MIPIPFTTRLISDGELCGFYFPSSFFETRQHILVSGTLNGKSFRAMAFPAIASQHVVYLSLEQRNLLGVQCGQEVEILLAAVEEGEAPLEVPIELLQALKKNSLSKTFACLPLGKRNEIIRWIEETMDAETHQSRIEKTINRLLNRDEIQE